MASLERMMAAVRGEPFDVYPFVNPYPAWSTMPHWPEMLGLRADAKIDAHFAV